MTNRVTYWTVKTAIIGNDGRTLFFRNKENAKAESARDFRDRPIKHTVKPENCPPAYIFED